MLTWVEEGCIVSRLWIDEAYTGAFVNVTAPARQGQVGLFLRAATGARHDVLDLEREIERRFRSTAVIATMTSAEGYPYIIRIHARRPRAISADRLTAACCSDSISASSSACSSVGS